MRSLLWLAGCGAVGLAALARGEEGPAPRTSLDNPAVRFTRLEAAHVTLSRGPLEAVIVDNRAVDDAVLPGHRAGYSGIGALRHSAQPRSPFVPAVSGLNYEHILDGTTQPRAVLYEPREARMELRRIDEHTVELHQPPTPHWKLESCLRYALLDDGAIELTLECIPREKTFKHGYINLFFASYIHQPESKDIHFRGFPEDVPEKVDWVRGVTPKHGELPTHLAAGDRRTFAHDTDFPLTLVFNRSRHRYAEPWYYGVVRGMALAQVFRSADRVRLTQSPSGGGQGNPAWDFQWFIENYEVGRRYQFVMRAVYAPFESPEQMARLVAPHRRALDGR